MSEQTQTKGAPSSRFSAQTWSPETWSSEAWAVAISILFIALIVAGIFPRVPW